MTPFQIAERFIGIKELPGKKHNPFILSMLRLDTSWPDSDEVPWCSAYVSFVAWLCRLPRSKSLAARSWLEVGVPVPLEAAQVGADVVILSRGTNPAQGHVGWFAGRDGDQVALLGGNQANQVSVQLFPVTQVLGVRRLA